jgi:hypothetical protein
MQGENIALSGVLPVDALNFIPAVKFKKNCRPRHINLFSQNR